MTANGTGVIEWDKKAEKIKKYYFKDFVKPRDFNYENDGLTTYTKTKMMYCG
ncbi:MAG: hypothetical protein IPK46_12990 [Saprospiraceae bacterium]|nr:hypothetical protein [Saprospiraceae bacterium]